MTSGALSRYYEILDGELNARYLESKRRRVDTNLQSESDGLWKAHDFLLSGKGGKDGSISLLDIKVELGRRILRKCTLCERRCEVDRARGEKGHCGVLEPRVSSDFIHMGEEPDLVPSHTVFFSGCTFNCVFCQNWDISTSPRSGNTISPKDLAVRIEDMVQGGNARSAPVRNVNWVGGDPTSNLPFILEVLRDCATNIPQVWNSNMYLTDESMKLLDGVVDVYLTDFKYGNDACAKRLSNAENYMKIIRRNHLRARSNGEMIIRHLVMPGHVECCTRPVLTWIAENLERVLVNVMSQYRPEHKARDFPEISRPVSATDCKKAVDIAEDLGLELTD